MKNRENIENPSAVDFTGRREFLASRNPHVASPRITGLLWIQINADFEVFMRGVAHGAGVAHIRSIAHDR